METTTLLSSTLTDWAAGEPCEKHELAFGGSCREQAQITRRADGQLHYDGDCTVTAFVETTGADYAEAADILYAAGYRPGHGASMAAIRQAYEAAGFTLTATGHTPATAAAATETSDRRYLVVGYRRSGHAWAIHSGRQHNAWYQNFRYQIFEVA